MQSEGNDLVEKAAVMGMEKAAVVGRLGNDLVEKAAVVGRLSTKVLVEKTAGVGRAITSQMPPLPKPSSGNNRNKVMPLNNLSAPTKPPMLTNTPIGTSLPEATDLRTVFMANLQIYTNCCKCLFDLFI